MTQTSSITSMWLTKTMRHCATGLLFVLPLGFIAAVGFGLADPNALIAQVPEAGLSAAPGGLNIAGAALCLVPAVLALMWALLEMRRLFQRYLAGDALSYASARHIGRIGRALLIAALAAIMGQMLSVMVLSLGNPPGARVLALSISGWQISAVMMAGFISLLGQAMIEAARLAEENRGFI